MQNLGDWMYEKMRIKAYNDVARENEEAMQEVLREATQKAAREAAEKSARKLFQKSVSYEIVRECIPGEVLSDEELHAIYDSVMCMS